MASSESEITSPSLFVSTLDVHIKSHCRKHVKSVILSTSDMKEDIPRPTSLGDSHQKLFDPPLKIPLDSNFSVSIRFRRMLIPSIVSISLDPRIVLSEANERDGRHVYSKTEKDIEVAVGIQSLPSTANEILASCPRRVPDDLLGLVFLIGAFRFRVLIMGKSGVGKSSLINKVFGVSSLHVSDTTRGEANINEGLVVPDNDRFVVHDSSGFEAGDQLGLDGVCDFITNRGKQNITDRLHAVWLCLEIPIAGGRVLETGVEEFLRQRDRILVNTPLVVVFTKLDSLVNMLSTQALQAGRFIDGDALEEQKREALEKHCFEPIRTAMGNDIVPFVAVSTAEDYEGSLSELVEKTTTDIQKLETVRYVAMMAQRVNITLKVKTTIALGEKKYWSMLKESPNFRGQTMKSCLDVLHKDIVTAWNFKGPQDSLYGEGFKEALLKTPEGQHSAQSSVSVVAALVPMMGELTVTANGIRPIVAGATVLHKLAHDQYKTSEDIVRQLMAYIVDLTCVMQILFLIITARDSEVSAELIDIAVKAYDQTYRPGVHDGIKQFSVNITTEAEQQDEVLDRIKELIDKYRIPAEDVVELQRQLQSMT